MGLDHQVLIAQGAESLGSREPPPPLVHSGNLPLRVDMGLILLIVILGSAGSLKHWGLGGGESFALCIEWHTISFN